VLRNLILATHEVRSLLRSTLPTRVLALGSGRDE
jgi:hypothetical protein